MKRPQLVADLGKEFAVSHFVFSSVERGGEGYDDHLLQDRAAKAAIERHIKSLEGLRWTILRPAFFMENFDGAIGSITTTVLRIGLKKETKLQLIVRPTLVVVTYVFDSDWQINRQPKILGVSDSQYSR